MGSRCYPVQIFETTGFITILEMFLGWENHEPDFEVNSPRSSFDTEGGNRNCRVDGKLLPGPQHVVDIH